ARRREPRSRAQEEKEKVMRPSFFALLLVLGCGSSPGTPPGDDAGAQPDAPIAIDAGATESACSGLLQQPVDSTWTIVSKGTNRTANVHVPVSYDPTKPTPVVLNFHGFTSDATQEALLSGMS